AGMLRACLSVSARLTRTPGGLRARVTVRADRVGHRVPTGFIDRNLVLVVEAQDAGEKPVPLTSGPTLSGLAGKGLARKAGRLYAKQWADKDGQSPLPFWRPGGRLTDTRL